MTHPKREGQMREMIKSIFLLSMILGAAQSINAKSHLLSTISNDEDQNTYTIALVTDEQDVDVKEVLKNEFDKRGKLVSQDRYTIKSLEDGVVMVKRSNYDIVRLKASNLNSSDSADLEMEVLVSAISKEKKSFDLQVNREGQKFKLELGGKSATKLHFITNKAFLIGTVGIKDIRVK